MLRAIEARRRSGLQPAPLEPERLQRLGEIATTAARRRGRPAAARADVNQTVQERAGRDDERTAAERIAVLQREADDAAVLDENPAGPADDPLDVRLGLERRPHPAP